MFPLKDNIPRERFPYVTIALIALNVIAYLISLRHGGSFFAGPSESVVVHYGAIPYELTHPGSHCELIAGVGGVPITATEGIACTGQPGITGTPSPQPATWETAITSMFLHASFLHIFGNMLFLAIFGPSVEDSMGHYRYVAFYLAGGLIALAAQTAVDPSSTAPTLGASGAIAAVLGGYIVLYPRARVLTLIFIVFFATVVELPAFALLGFWILTQVYLGTAGLAGAAEGGVAYFAHIGGFAFGAALIWLFARNRRTVPPRYPVY
jgi:membrane associated rhomboid family serine protease